MKGVLNKERQDLITENMDLVKILINRRCENVPWLKDEMESALLCKLCECAASYDFMRDCSFRTYASKSMDWTLHNNLRKECQRGLSFANKVSTNELLQHHFVDIDACVETLADTTSCFVDNILDLEAALNSEEREIVLLMLHGYSLQEISDLFGCNYSTFTTRVQRLRSKIRVAWFDDGIKAPA